MLLKEFIDAEGHPNVPQGTALGSWVNNQRRKFKADSLTEQQKALLYSVEFQWRMSESKK